MNETLDLGVSAVLPVGETTGKDAIPEEMIQTVEALLFAAHEPLPVSTLAPSLNGSAVTTIDQVVIVLNQRLTEGAHPMRVRRVAGGYQMYVLPQFGPAIAAALIKTKIQRLSRAGLETLAIIAYKQPCSTPEIERIRGVSCGGVLNTLLERNLISIAGRSEGPGRPLQYGTTREFLRYFGLDSIDDLPRIEELEKMMAEHGSAPLSLSHIASRSASEEDAETLEGTVYMEETPGRLVMKHAPENLQPQSPARRFWISDIIAMPRFDNRDVAQPGNGDGEPAPAEVDPSGWVASLRTN